ncbi:MAG TPA: sigma factor-like helix-turn-helix DNA-binding protein [Candidatus Paceibacterota bacterium]|nr:sigma factor-like helix-turn-helix DNA-binding protein [Candidatus Paceibacterota bacterium]HMP18766.1 sigma factor-like helix-turn-helix DNA-binding protein [Candidatus Paceibacterota bacterium]HMP85337.1 sigma factor-like helix-turn-helix DNA-binding protein [Candidatus Paceibacterota bacterium]
MIKLSFQPKEVTKKLISGLSQRSKDVLLKRYGLSKNTDRLTLESIGKEYNITRERVRQIEEHSLSSIRKSDAYNETIPVFEELKGVIDDLGGVVSEEDLLNHLSLNETIRNHIHFLLVIGDHFVKLKEDDHFNHRWSVNTNLASSIEESIKKIYSNLKDDDIIPESELIKSFLNHVQEISEKYKREEVVKRWLRISKKIAQNPLGEWGKIESPNINVKGIRDYAFLVIRKHGSPIHFKELADQISKVFNRKAHVATCHNELIKDERFVLVGRGLYALTEWGYSPGVVRDVIKNILQKHGPLTKEEIIEKVLKERYVKDNTVLVNLQNQSHFKKDKSGKYTLVV